MNWEDRLELTMMIMIGIVGFIVSAILFVVVLVNAPVAVLIVFGLAAVSFGLTFSPQLFHRAIEMWKNRK